MKQKIALVRPEDVLAVLAADVFDGPAQRLATMRLLGEHGTADPCNILLLAERNDRVVGFACGTVLYHPDKPPNRFVQELGVNEEARRQGIARALIARLREEGRARGCTTTWVLTEAQNAPARATYVAAGGSETTGVVMYEWDETKPG